MNSPFALDAAARRHSRSIAAGYDLKIVTDAKVVLVGVGALGQNIAQNLALAGVGSITVIDFDDFEDHNLTRSPLYPRPDQLVETAHHKALGVARRLEEITSASHPVIRAIHQPVQRAPVTILRDADVIISAVDSNRARHWLARMARLLERPFVEGGFHASAYNTTTFSSAAEDPCFACYSPDTTSGFSCSATARQLSANAIIPALQTTAAVLAGLMTEAVFTILHGKNDMTPACRVVSGDIRTAQTRIATITRNPNCTWAHNTAHIQPGTIPPPSDWHDVLDTLPPGHDLLLPTPVVLSAQCPACGNWTRPNTIDQHWEQHPFCNDCTIGGHPTTGAYPALDVVERIARDDIAGRLTDLPLANGGITPGGAVFTANGEDVTVRFIDS